MACTLDPFIFGVNDYALRSVQTTYLHTIREACYLDPVSTNNHVITYDLSSNFLLFEPANFLAITDFKNFTDGGFPVTVHVESDSVIGFTAPTTQSFTITSLNDLVGVLKKDFARKLTAFTVKKRYWRVRIVTPTSFIGVWRGLCLGESFKFSRQPLYGGDVEINDRYPQALRNNLLLDYTFDKITSEEKKKFDERILDYADVMPIYLYDPQDLVFWGQKLIRCMLTDCTSKFLKGGRYYNLSMKFEELL